MGSGTWKGVVTEKGGNRGQREGEGGTSEVGWEHEGTEKEGGRRRGAGAMSSLFYTVLRSHAPGSRTWLTHLAHAPGSRTWWGNDKLLLGSCWAELPVSQYSGFQVDMEQELGRDGELQTQTRDY